MRILIIPGLIATLALSLVSCENEELAAKREQQKLEIRRLEAELAVAKAKLGEPIPDYRKELKDTQDSLTRVKEEIVAVEDEVASLREEKRETEREFANYHRKYPLRGKSSN